MQIGLAKRLGKGQNMTTSYVQNRQQKRLVVLFEIANIWEAEPKN